MNLNLAAVINWNDSLNLAVDESQSGRSPWVDSLNTAVREGQMKFGAVAELPTKSDDGNGVEDVIEFRVVTGEGDEIEIELKPQNVRDQER